MAAFDALAREYERVNAALADLRGGQVGLFDLTKTVLNNNLYGVDLNSESVEITKLSLWLKTVQRGRKLTYLDSNIKWGDSIVKDPDLSRVAFDWASGKMARSLLDPSTAPEAAEIDAHWRERFDVVLGNPPYIRQELLAHMKEHLRASYGVFHGMADIFVYFFERGLSVLKPGGRLGFIVTNKWLRSEYAERLRLMLAKTVQVEALVDFGHAPVFPDVDVFPCIITLRKPIDGEEPAVPPDHTLSITLFPRELLKEVSVPEYFGSHRFEVPQSRLGGESWSLEPPTVDALLNKIRKTGLTLAEYAGVKPLYGVKSGLNEAFLIDTSTRNRIISSDSRAEPIIKKYLRGQDVNRWAAEWAGLWVILLKSSADHSWAWSGLDEASAEKKFASTLPGLYAHLSAMEQMLKRRADKGRYWWELRSCAYYDAFTTPKIVYQEIQFHPSYALDRDGMLLNNKCFLLPTSDAWLLAVLNSPLMWWYNWRNLPHMKDEALTPLGVKMVELPIARPSDEARAGAERIVPRLIEIVKANNETRAGVLDLLRMQYGVENPGQKLEGLTAFTSDEFIAEVIKRRPKSAGKLKTADLKRLRDIYDEEALPIQERQREARDLERQVAVLIDEAYGLTPGEVELMWSTAPPRMPIGK